MACESSAAGIRGEKEAARVYTNLEKGKPESISADAHWESGRERMCDVIEAGDSDCRC